MPPIFNASNLRVGARVVAAAWHRGQSVFSAGWGAEIRALASTRTVKIGMMGTSLAAQSNGSMQKLKFAAARAHKSAMHSVARAGAWGGSFESAQSGWSKQPYGGRSFVRLRGSSVSSELHSDGYFDTLRVYYSTEADGGQFNVTVGGVVVGTVDCNGAQSYGNFAEFSVPKKAQKLSFVPPASGFAYLESFEAIDTSSSGVTFRDDTLGGSMLRNAVTVRTPTGAQVEGVVITGNNGLNALAGDDLDYAIISFTVNDAGSNWAAGYADALDVLVSTMLANGTKVALIVEMAGHYSRTQNNAFQQSFIDVKNKILSMSALPGVTVIDWDSSNRIDDVAAYAAAYYTNVTVSEDQTFTGDFIHPRPEGYVTLDAALGALFGATVTPLSTAGIECAIWSRHVPLGTPATKSVVVDGEAKTLPVVGATLRGVGAVSAGFITPVYHDPSAFNRAASIQTDIDASPLHDDFGPYLEGSRTLSMNGNTTRMVHLVCSGNVNIRMDGGSTVLDLSAVESDNSDVNDRTIAARLPAPAGLPHVFSLSARVKVGSSGNYVVVDGPADLRLYSASVVDSEDVISVSGIV